MDEADVRGAQVSEYTSYTIADEYLFKTHSQAGQDLFVFDQLVAPTGYTNGVFLDIGCGFPIEINNTYSLEQLGWRGVLVDKDPEFVALCRQQRQSPVIEADATTMIWANDSGRVIDYLSLDIDDEEGKESKVVIVLKKLLTAGLSFRVITLEHDRYHLGDGTRNATREILLSAGYTLARPDVAHDGLEYEDWWTKNV
jgi:hypothetical protein